MRRKLSQALSVFIVAALFGVLVKISIDPSKTEPNVGTATHPTYNGLRIALPDNMKSFPTGVLAQP